jgi:hypothetical protein
MSAVAIPTSIIGTFIFIDAFGFSLNVLSLLALSLSVGILIDDAIVVLENIYRHMEEASRAYEVVKIINLTSGRPPGTREAHAFSLVHSSDGPADRRRDWRRGRAACHRRVTRSDRQSQGHHPPRRVVALRFLRRLKS